jgi:hypothetical protein
MVREGRMGKTIGAMKVERLHEDFGQGVESEWKGMSVKLGEEGRPTFSVQSAMASLRGRSGLSSFLPSFPLIRNAKALLRFCCDRLLLMHVAPAGLARERCREGLAWKEKQMSAEAMRMVANKTVLWTLIVQCAPWQLPGPCIVLTHRHRGTSVFFLKFAPGISKMPSTKKEEGEEQELPPRVESKKLKQLIQTAKIFSWVLKLAIIVCGLVLTLGPKTLMIEDVKYHFRTHFIICDVVLLSMAAFIAVFIGILVTAAEAPEMDPYTYVKEKANKDGKPSVCFLGDDHTHQSVSGEFVKNVREHVGAEMHVVNCGENGLVSYTAAREHVGWICDFGVDPTYVSVMIG